MQNRYVAGKSDAFILKRIQKEKANGLYKKGTFMDEIIWGNNSYFISKQNKRKNKSFKAGMFLFGMVRKDANEYINKNTIKLPKRYPQIEYSSDFKEEFIGVKITGTDLNHAYWRIALNLGIIKEKTYQMGLPDDFKSVRLAALSTLGAGKKYNVIKNGNITSEIISINENPPLQNIYKLIRYTCYNHMAQVKKKLGKDFLCYKTDCIYYIDNIKNRKIVQDFFEKKNISVKQLIER